MTAAVRVTKKGAERWAKGHPWIFASDVDADHDEPGIVTAVAANGRPLGQALFSPRSEIRLRLLDTRSAVPIDVDWWRTRIREALGRRAGIDANAYRVVYGEGDGLPSLVIDRYDRWVVAQLLSAGLETRRADILAAIDAELAPEGVLLRHDVGVRRQEGLPHGVELVAGAVPQDIEVREGPIRYLAAPWTGQKTGAFLDQRHNRQAIARLVPAGGRALDCFSYHGSFALHLAARATAVLALDVSTEALDRGAVNARLNGFDQITFREADAFEELRALERRRERFDVVAVDPPAFAKSKGAVTQALRGYKEINLRAIRVVAPGGALLTASCSFHVRWPEFLGVIAAAAADSGRRVTVIGHQTQPPDHPEVITIPETGYLKAVVLRVD
ncbi:MAG: class I SAM-dependent rRNA methyltransferase [Gemmatimonadales bacterium]